MVWRSNRWTYVQTMKIMQQLNGWYSWKLYHGQVIKNPVCFHKREIAKTKSLKSKHWICRHRVKNAKAFLGSAFANNCNWKCNWNDNNRQRSFNTKKPNKNDLKMMRKRMTIVKIKLQDVKYLNISETAKIILLSVEKSMKLYTTEKRPIAQKLCRKTTVINIQFQQMI